MWIELVFLAACCGSVEAFGKTAKEWKSKVIYQVLTDRFARTDERSSCGDLGNYCGGTFQGLVNKLDYIQGLGVDAIWISPVVENTDGGYHGYWAKNIFKINPHFGRSDDLKILVDECHRRGLWVMVDVVANHMGYPPGCPACSMEQRLNFSTLVPFNKSDHYHPYCEIQDWNDQHQSYHDGPYMCQNTRVSTVPIILDTDHPSQYSTRSPIQVLTELNSAQLR